MNKLFRTLLVGTILAVGTDAVALAAGAPDPVVGSWTLNLEKSTYSPGPAPKSQTRTYAESADGIALTITGVAADGTSMSGQSTFKYDGKNYSITGSPDFDALTLQRVNGSTVKSTLKRAGKVIGSTVRTISGHGKILTLASKGRDTKGARFLITAVFDKQ